VYERTALNHHHEIGLKGRNRSTFVSRLKGNLDFAVQGLTGAEVERISSRPLAPVSDRARASMSADRRWTP
jgi:thiamine biosynthesis protein ThiI